MMVGLLRRITGGTVIDDLEREISQLETRRSLLDKQRAAAAQRLNEAVADRRARLVEADADQLGPGTAKAVIGRLRDEADAHDDALAVVGERLSDARTRLAAERDRQARQAEGELRSNEIARARSLAAEFSMIGADLGNALQSLAPVAPEVAAAAGNVRHMVQQLALGVEWGLTSASAYIERIVGGEEPIRTAPAVPPPAPAPAKVERRSVVVLQASKWQEPSGEVVTAGRLTQAHVPLLIAQRALDIGNAIPVDSLEYRRLRDGRLLSARDPSGHERAWWCQSVDVGRVIRRARKDGDVAGAAVALGVRIVDHDHVLQRAQESVQRLDARVAGAQRNGDLSFFNSEYRRRRQEAFVQGRSFMPYGAAKARLKNALVGVAAGDRPALVARVFEDRFPDPQ
jgi:hypothetical protein